MFPNGLPLSLCVPNGLSVAKGEVVDRYEKTSLVPGMHPDARACCFVRCKVQNMLSIIADKQFYVTYVSYRLLSELNEYAVLSVPYGSFNEVRTICH